MGRVEQGEDIEDSKVEEAPVGDHADSGAVPFPPPRSSPATPAAASMANSTVYTNQAVEISVSSVGEPWTSGLFDCHEDQTNGWNGYLAQQQAAQRKYQAEVMTPPLNQNMSKEIVTRGHDFHFKEVMTAGHVKTPSPSRFTVTPSPNLSGDVFTVRVRRNQAPPFASVVRNWHVVASTLTQERLSVVAGFTHAGHCSPPAGRWSVLASRRSLLASRWSVRPLVALMLSLLASCRSPVAARFPPVGPAAGCTFVVAARLPTGLFCIGKYLPPIVLIDEFHSAMFFLWGYALVLC
ncbi:hypothetical protein Scep_024376 [Stephania cephalantha]|uniref:Uncharacterized protein n=1 Tax=Stephania cephalantha TaxID=152367 RepID=A0AAP0EXM5_9MAGN